MYKYLLVFLILLFPTFANANVFIEKKVGVNTLRVVKYDFSNQDYKIKIVTSDDEISLDKIMLENNAISGVNGVFFCPKDYTACKPKTHTINERYTEGLKLGVYDNTGERVVFGWEVDGNPFLFQTDKINPERENDIYYGFANHPLLLKDGENYLEYYYEAGLIDKKMQTRGTRNFVCNDTFGNIYFGLVTLAYMDDMPGILVKELGCENALNLDAGLSTVMQYNGITLAGPGRPILDAIVVEKQYFDARTTADNIEKVLNNYKKEYLQNYDEKSWPIFVEKLSVALNKLKGDIYNRNSSEVFDENFAKVGYQIDMRNDEDFKLVYAINRILEWIRWNK